MMKSPYIRIAQIGLMAMTLTVALTVLAPSPALADAKKDTRLKAATGRPEVSGAFTGKLVCEKDSRAAEFRDISTQKTTNFTYNEISHRIGTLNWQKPNDVENFEEIQDEKKSLQSVIKLMQDMKCSHTYVPTRPNSRLDENGMVITTKPQSDYVLVPSANSETQSGAGSSTDVLVPSTNGGGGGNARSSSDVLVPSSH